MVVKEHITDLFFDLDHTIYDFDKNSALTFEAVFKELNIADVSNFMSYFKPINNTYWERFANNEISRDFLRYWRLRDTFTAINVQISDKEIYYIADYFIENLSNYNHVYNGAHETLEHLQNRYRLHIITNGPEVVQERKLIKTNLHQYFNTITNSEKAGVKKPNVEIFKYALVHANCKPEHGVMIGDNLQADIHGALNAGMSAIWFNEFNNENNIAVQEIQHLKQLLDIL